MNPARPTASIVSRTTPVCVIMKNDALKLGFADGIGDGNEDRIGEVGVFRAVGEVELWPPVVRRDFAGKAKACGSIVEGMVSLFLQFSATYKRSKGSTYT